VNVIGVWQRRVCGKQYEQTVLLVVQCYLVIVNSILFGQFCIRRVEKQSSKIVYFCTVDCENVCGYDVGIGAV
jgi:hypothetical protein